MTSGFNAFGPFGQRAFSSRKPRAQVIYESLRDGMGDTYDESFNGPAQARLYAQAMCLASAQYQIDRAANNANPEKATELLPELERDYQITPAYNATLNERRAELAARARATQGNRRSAVERALQLLLGDDFVDYVTINSPSDIVSWPRYVTDVGVFARAGAQRKIFKITSRISLAGTPERTYDYTLLANSERPIPGEAYTVDPDSRGSPERVVLTAVTDTTITGLFQRAHEPGTIAVAPHPVWISNQRYNLVRVTQGAAQDPVKVRKVNELMDRILRGVSRWGISTDLGYLTPDDPVLGDPRVARPQ